MRNRKIKDLKNIVQVKLLTFIQVHILSIPFSNENRAYCTQISEPTTALPSPTPSIPSTTVQIEPCLSYTVLPHYEYRYIQNTVNENSSIIHDRNLTERWYRAGNLDIPNIVSNLFQCGTIYPGYMTGTHSCWLIPCYQLFLYNNKNIMDIILILDLM